MENYNLELDKAVESIKKNKAKLVCIQLPDGLKPKAMEIKGYIEENTNASVIIWLGSCFGACDVPCGIEDIKADLLIQFGHEKFVKGW
jgi:diphthamide biosynthesis enzyme Dph1/Dph2-like protein